MEIHRERERNGSHQGNSTTKTLKNISSTKLPILIVSIRFDLSTTNSDLKFHTKESTMRQKLETHDQRNGRLTMCEGGENAVAEERAD